jgi:asparagine synthase (glutamine-hydrolysing)
MSAQAGIFYFDGRPIEPTLPGRLNAALAEFGPDGGGEYTAAGLVMVHRALHVTPEDCLERQPYVSARGNVMTWDGRLDNRDDLLLQLWRALQDDTTDVALAMAVYERWGIDGFVRMIGDWSLAVWNVEARSLVLASDFAGVRPLYYMDDGGSLRWSSSLRVLSPDQLTTGANVGFLVGFAAFAAPAHSTPYHKINSVAPGNAEAWVSNGTSRQIPFWHLPTATVRYRDTRAYAEELRSLFASSVKARLRSIKPVWIELSGGLDSSSIACVAHRLIAHGRSLSPGIQTLSYTSTRFPEADESRFIRIVEAQLGRPGHHVALEDSIDLIDADGDVCTPHHPSGTALAMFRRTAENGGRVLLSGAVGDLIMGNSQDASIGVLEDLAERAPLGALLRLREWSRASHETMWTLLSRIIGETGPPTMLMRRSLIETVRGHGRSGKGSLQELASEIFLLTAKAASVWEENLRQLMVPVLSFPSPVKRRMVRGLLTHIQQRTLQTPSEFPGILHSYPYMHRPLVEFVLGIPLGELCRPGQPRFLMREAFRPFIPDRILMRRSKGYIAPFHTHVVKCRAPQLLERLESLHVVMEGVIDPSRLQTKLRAVQQGAIRDVGNLLMIARLEQWLVDSNSRLCARAQISA